MFHKWGDASFFVAMEVVRFHSVTVNAVKQLIERMLNQIVNQYFCIWQFKSHYGQLIQSLFKNYAKTTFK